MQNYQLQTFVDSPPYVDGLFMDKYSIIVSFIYHLRPEPNWKLTEIHHVGTCTCSASACRFTRMRACYDNFTP